MPSIQAEPASLKSFLKPIRNFFKEDVTSYNFAWRFIVGLAFLFSHKSGENISKLFGGQRTRQSFDNFFNKRDWDCRELLQVAAMRTLRELGWKPGEPLYLALDDTQNEKRANKMEAVSKIFLHTEKRYANGHILIACAIIYRGVTIPYGIRIWVGKNNFVKLAQKYGWTSRPTINDLAAELIRSFKVTKKTKVTVVFDRYYLNEKVVKACNDMGYRYIGAVKSNRVLAVANNKKNTVKIGSYIGGLIRWHGEYTTIEGSRLLHRIASKLGSFSKIGLVQIVCSRREGESKILTLATNDTSLSPKDVVTMYRNRWDIEILFKTSKQYLGLGDYQLLQYRAIEKYLHLVLCAHCLLTHQANIALDEKEKKYGNKTPVRIGVYKAKLMFQGMIVNDCFEAIFNNRRYEKQSKRFIEKIKRTFLGQSIIGFICSV